jgi:lambda repressor-like predicted transcriptional regulator
MRQQLTITDTVVSLIKEKIRSSGLSLQAISRNTGISYYTIWCISRGKYDTKEPLQGEKYIDKEMFQVHEKENWLI